MQRIQVTLNKGDGNQFEELFKGAAKRDGFLVIKNYLTGYYLNKNRFIVVPGELDFKIIKSGRVAYLDCKAYSGGSFAYSVLSKHQIDRALTYNANGVASGFIVLFKDYNRVVFFSGQHIARVGPRHSFSINDGLYIGSVERLNLDLLWPIK